MSDHEIEDMGDEPITKKKLRDRHPVTMASIISIMSICVVILPLMTVVFRPFVVGLLASALSSEIQAQSQRQTQPLSNGFKVILRSQIMKLQDEVDELEFTQSDAKTRTALGAKRLASKRRELEDQREALAAIEASEKPKDGK